MLHWTQRGHHKHYSVKQCCPKHWWLVKRSQRYKENQWSPKAYVSAMTVKNFCIEVFSEKDIKLLIKLIAEITNVYL
jgi:hypothetical protein